MNYDDTLEFLFSSLPMYQRIGKAAYKSDLDTTIRLDNHLGKPHRAFKTIHIAGTNGKGSVSHMLAAVLQSAGYRTGLYTSPHYTDFRERIRIDGVMIDEASVVDFVEVYRDIMLGLKASFFEMTVAMALSYFKEKKVDIAVIETGMGGRLDSTNIITPLVSVITNIGLDHTQYLGETPEKIAGEKAGIIKPGVPVVVGQAEGEVREIFAAKARETNSDIYIATDRYRVEKLLKEDEKNSQAFNIFRDDLLYQEEISTDLMGDYQAFNLVTLFQVIEVLGKVIDLKPDKIGTGLINVSKLTGFAGRWQVIRQSPTVICDSGHNADGLRQATGQLMKMEREKLHIVLGMVNDKDIKGILVLLPREAIYYFTRADIPRALDAGLLRDKALEYGLRGDAYPGVAEAYEAALIAAGQKDVIFVGGSSFVVADFLKANRAVNPEKGENIINLTN